MKERFTAFSINSMDMKMIRAFRRKRTPATPIRNSSALKPR
jgi:hypothetical protein